MMNGFASRMILMDVPTALVRRRLPIDVSVVAALFAISMFAANTAAAADIRVYSSGAPSSVERDIATTFQPTTGNNIIFTVATPGIIAQKLANGERADIVVLPTPAIDAMKNAGTLRPNSRVDLARVGIGIVVRKGAQVPDISTLAAIRMLLLNARSIVHTNPTGSGFAGAAVARMIEQMGIADAVRPKITVMQAIDGGVDLVANGKAEVGLFNISEILPVKGVTLVGPLPAEVQSYIVFTAAIRADSNALIPAQDFIKLLSDPSNRERWKAGGLEPLSAGR
jgi:molybdate transport system substrate-binding protein